MKEIQTPHKLPPRSAENRHGRSKDFPHKKSNNKIPNKSLNAAFTSVSQDFTDSSPVSEISYANCNEDATIDLLEESSSVILLRSDETPKKITDTTEISSSNSMEVEIAVNFLRNAKPDLVNSVNAASQYRKLMDEIIEYAIQSHDLHTGYTLSEDRDYLAQLLSAKNGLLFLFVFIWIIGIAIAIFFAVHSHGRYRGPMPT
ncbi:protein SINE3 [Lotus japonicus]|uniref:protein SINE3 n=1 Tax=Lotus japonicus TaxID=34305 RepID=UPI0025867884|nr:protein SINE3 [Lotus japonicus]